MARRTIGGLAFAAALLALASAGPVSASSASSSLKGWRDGPVRVLLTSEEYERFGSLHTDDERRAFVEAFWRELDEHPGANGPDFRATFDKRVAVANARFATIWEEGWETDRGRVYLALGEPTAVRHESGGLKAVDKEVWRYDAAQDPATALEIDFYRCSDGTYRTDPSCPVNRDTNSVSFDWERTNYLRTLRGNNPGLSNLRVRQMLNELLDALPKTEHQGGQAPSTSAAIADVAASDTTASAASSTRLEDAGPYYFRAQDGSVLALIVLGVQDEDGTPPVESTDDAYLAAAALEATDSHGAPVRDAAPHTTVLDRMSGHGRRQTFFGRAYLDPGRSYAVRYVVKDGARGEVLVKHGHLQVPDLRSGFSTSSLVPAERFGPARGQPDPYQIGSEEVVPKADATFKRSELLRLYLQVYGAAIDPERSMARVDVVFRFQRVVKGKPKPYGKPFSVREAAGAAMGLALPIGDWPTGDYRVTVDLHDRVSGQRLDVSGEFTIVDG